MKKQKKIKKFNIKRKTINFFIILYEIIKKDIKLLIRSKTSALVILFGPLLIIFLVGLAFNTSSLYNLKVSTYSDSYSELTESIITILSDQQYTVKKAFTQEECIDGIGLGQHHVCIIFPAEMTIDNAEDNIVKFYVDESRTNLAHLISNTISSKIAQKSSEVSLSLTQSLVNTLESTKQEIEEKKTLLDSLEATSSSSRDSVENIKTRFTELDLTIDKSDLNISEAKKEINRLISKYNYSESIFDDLKSKLKEVEDGVQGLEDKFLAVEEVKLASDSDLNSLKTELTAMIGNINSLKASFEQIKANVDSIKVTNVESIVSPIKTTIESVTAKKTHLSFLFPTLVVLVLMFISILLSSTLVIREKISPAYFRNFITPVSDFVFMFGTYLTNVILVMFQIFILLIAFLYFFKGDVFVILLNSSLILLVSASVFILFGMFIGYLFKTEETSTLGAIAVGSLMLFFSNTILPVETLPGIFRYVSLYNPFVIAEQMLKKVMLFNVNLSALSTSFYILIGFIVVFFVLGLIARELTKRYFE